MKETSLFDSMQKTLCLVPCFNEEANLPFLLEEAKKHQLRDRCDLIFLDDASTDRTRFILEASGSPVIRHSTNLGYGACVKTGIQYCKNNGYDRMAVFPGDHQRSFQDLFRLLEPTENPFDVVIGKKLQNPKAIPFFRYCGNVFFSALAKVLWKAPYSDVLSGFKIYRVISVLPFLDLLPDRYEFDLVFSFYCRKFSLSVREMPVSVRYHAYSTKMTNVLGVGARMLASSFKIFYGRNSKRCSIGKEGESFE